MTAKIVIKNSESGNSFEFDLTRDETHIGRAADRNDVVLEASQVSRQHAIIKRNRQAFTLIDLNSANGTFMNGERVKEHPLRNGDSFSISKFTIEFKDAAGAPSVRYASHEIEGTMVMRTPGEISAVIPQMDKAAISKTGPDSK